MPQLTIATAAVFCHRFFACHSHGEPLNDRFMIATACLFLAGKVEETPKPLKEVVRVSYLIQHKQEYERAFRHIQQKVCLEEQRESILQAERLLLHTLGFDFNVEHPYKHLLNVAKRINQAQNVKESDSRSLAQVAWNFANDSLRTTLCLQFAAQDIANAVLFLAAKLLHSTLDLPEDWWVVFEMKQSICEDISNQIMDLYDESEH
eukprot:CAMPEP_0181348956 /NCGR_PEP_ID=MMETSP1106-20121128/468_1 /TAXON_ID=81844 /ORGANISM="Mantoniella antarctica, Strain SL-175" /LENGTH=205 /DNA_ID=CAMNT_0023461315 /DNA_START=793 /DNA_END=1410 /DNA_ORIENTATION=+